MTATSTAADDHDPPVGEPTATGDEGGAAAGGGTASGGTASGGTAKPLTAPRLGDLTRRAYAAAQSEVLLVAVLAGAFLARWLIASRNSYWLDELYSVTIYGIWNDSASAAVNHLANTSVHPPLYQFILYNWMELFGDDERATRSLSNLYITLATLFLYLLLRDAFSRRAALASAVAFTLMYTPMYYGLETRSYAQTIFLITLSSYALLRMLRLGADRGWRSALFSPTALLFLAANLGLLLTHYYNVFVWIGQGVIAGVFVLRERSPRAWFAGLGTVAVLYGLPGGAFWLVWGHVLIDDYRRRGGDFAAEDGVRSPLDLLRTVVAPNLDPPRLLWWLGLGIAAVMVIRAAITLVRRGGLSQDRQRAWTVAYLVAWLLVPLLVAYLAFVVTGVARYHPRYWLFVVPPLAPLVILTVEQAADLVGRAWRRVRGSRPDLTAWANVAAVAVVAAVIFPGTVAAADRTKQDWRGTAQDIVAIVRSNPDSSYLIYETSFRSTPVLDYYLSRYSRRIRVTATIRQEAERGNEEFSFERDAELIAQHDFLIVAFTHHRTTEFPNAIEELSQRYEVHQWQTNRGGRGLVIFSVSPDEGASDGPERAGTGAR